MRKLRKSISTVCLLTICFVIVGCSPKENNTSKGVTLKVMTNRSDLIDTELKKIGEEYAEKTGVNIEWEAVEDYSSTMNVRIRANDNYGDVFLCPNLSKEEYSKYLEPLGKASDPKIAAYRVNNEFAIKEDGDYTVYGLSYGLAAQGVVYSKSAFEKAGIDAESMKTIDGFYQGCAKLKEAGIMPVATNFKDSWVLKSWYTSAKCISGDPDFENNLYKEDSVFSNTKPLGEILDFGSTLIKNGWVEDDLLNTDWDKAKKGLANGSIGMMFLGSWVIPQEKALSKDPEDIGFMPVPTKDGVTYTVLEPDYTVAVSNKSKHKKEAIDFLFAFNESSYPEDNGLIPNNTNNKKLDPVTEEFLNSGVKEIIENPASKDDQGKTENVFKKANINHDTYVQNPFLYSLKENEKFDLSVGYLNEDWNNAKKELGY